MKTQLQETAKIFENIFKFESTRLRKWIRFADKLLLNKTHGNFARCHTGECIVHQIIADTLQNDIAWDRTRVPDIDRFMIMYIKSRIISILKKERKFPCSIEDKNIKREISLQQNTGTGMRIDNTGLIERCREKLSGDDKALSVFELMLQNYRSREISMMSRLSLTEVENIKTRLRRKLVRMFVSNGIALNRYTRISRIDKCVSTEQR